MLHMPELANHLDKLDKTWAEFKLIEDRVVNNGPGW